MRAITQQVCLLILAHIVKDKSVIVYDNLYEKDFKVFVGKAIINNS